jgi:hypothetical protein
MKKLILLLITIFILISCNSNTEIISGDLYFKQVDWLNYYRENDSNKQEIQELFQAIKANSSLSITEEKMVNQYGKLEKLNLLDTPYIRIKTEKDVKVVFMTEEDFEKVREYNLQDLLETNQKVNLKLEVEEVDTDFFMCKQIIEFYKVSGVTPWEK